MKHTDSRKRRVKIITVLLVVMFCFAAASGTLAALNTTAIANNDAPPSAQPTALPDEDLAANMTDDELARIGTVLDDTGVSLMPANFSFVDYTAPDPTPTPTSEPDKSAEPKTSSPTQTQKAFTIADYQKLRPGMKTDAVRSLQQRLMDLSYLANDEPSDYYGTQTAYAVQLFQYRNDLNADGVMNEQTTKLLFSKNAKKYKVSIGVSGTDVTELQKRLKELGYLSKVTGYFGSDTDAAVRAFQKANGLTVDGQVGSDTREAIYSDSAVPAAAKPTKTKTPVKTPTPTRTKTPTPTRTKTHNPTKTKTPSKTPTPTKTPASESASNPPDTAKAAKLIATAKTHLGAPYVWGGKGPDTFDCSGFVYYCINEMGTHFYYRTSAGWAASSYPTISKADLKAGDILCFQGHVGIYLGNGSMIDASSAEGKVRITYNIWSSSYWNSHFLYGKRFFVAK